MDIQEDFTSHIVKVKLAEAGALRRAFDFFTSHIVKVKHFLTQKQKFFSRTLHPT